MSKCAGVLLVFQRSEVLFKSEVVTARIRYALQMPVFIPEIYLSKILIKMIYRGHIFDILQSNEMLIFGF